MYRIYLTAFLFLLISPVWGLTDAPTLLKACMNVNDSVVTILYRTPTDVCGSFQEYHVYGKDPFSSYTIRGKQTDFFATSVQIKLPNANGNWSFYLEALYTCSGSDSIKSNVISVDDVRPSDQSIDSISVDLSTQNFVVGWTANSSTDTKGYRVYSYSKANDISSIIDDTSGLAFNETGKSVDQPNWFTLSAFDSCGLFSRVSDPHSPILLHGTLNPCNREYSLNWSAYVGWNTLEHTVYKSLNGSPFAPASKNVTNTSDILQLSPGDSACFFVRAYSQNPGVTSSSNVVCAQLDTIQTPTSVYLSTSSVNESDVIDIEVFIDNLPPTDSLVIFYVTASNEEPVDQFRPTVGKQTFTTSYSPSSYANPELFIARSYAPCVGQTDSSNLSKTIFLSTDNAGNLIWNEFINWDGGVDHYEVYGKNDINWEWISDETSLSYPLGDTAYSCYRVKAVESPNTFGWSQESWSNSHCVAKPPTFFVPNALNTQGTNHTFRVIGTSLDYDQSSFEIFNRWGEVIYRSKRVDVGWNILSEGTDIPTGLYLYTLSIVDLSGNKHKSSGSFSIIR